MSETKKERRGGGHPTMWRSCIRCGINMEVDERYGRTMCQDCKFVDPKFGKR